MARSRPSWLLIGLYVLYFGVLGYLTLGPQPLEELPLDVDRVLSWFADVRAVDNTQTATADGGVGAARAAVIVGNVLLFLPVGIITRREIHRSLTAALVAGLLVSGTIELLQLTLATWRHPQVVDLVLNTVGAGLGWGLAQMAAVLRRQ